MDGATGTINIWVLALQAIIGVAVPIIVSVIANRKNPKKEDAEADCSSADAVDSYASAATKFASQVIALQTRIDELTTKQAAQEQVQIRQQKRIDELERENVDLRGVVDKLIDQLKALNQQPVAVPRARSGA